MTNRQRRDDQLGDLQFCTVVALQLLSASEYLIGHLSEIRWLFDIAFGIAVFNPGFCLFHTGIK